MVILYNKSDSNFFAEGFAKNLAILPLSVKIDLANNTSATALALSLYFFIKATKSAGNKVGSRSL